jgi:flagellin
MALTINTNVPSLDTQRNLRKSEGPLNTAMQRLSSGLRINSAKDDAAGMSIATRMDTQVRGMSVAIKNTNEGLSFIQTAEGALNEMVSDVQRIYELSVQSSSYNTETDRASMNVEVNELVKELDRIVTQTRYNGEQFLNRQVSWSYQVGTKVDENITVNTLNLSPKALGITTSASNEWNSQQVAQATWSTYSASSKNELGRKFTINNVDMGGAIPGKEIANNSKILADRINRYTSETEVSAMSFGNAIVAERPITAGSGGAAGESGFITINGVSMGSFSKGEITKQERDQISSGLQSEKSKLIAQELDKIEKEAAAAPENAPLVESELSDSELAAQRGQARLDELIDQKSGSVIGQRTAANVATAINDRSTETGVKAYIVSSARLVLANTSGSSINYNIDISKFVSKKGDGSKDIDIGLNVNGGKIDGGQNGIIVLNDKNFGKGVAHVDSTATTELFGYGVVTLNSKKSDIQGRQESASHIILNKKSVADMSIDTVDNSKLTMLVTGEVLDTLNSFKSTLGAQMNRMESTIRNLDNVRENISAARSRIQDADFAEETANLTKSMIIQQAGISVLSQANSSPSRVLALLQ